MTATLCAARPAVRLTGGTHVLPGGRPLFSGLDLTVEAGESLVLLGPSGAGKSTLLRILAGLADLHGGELEFPGSPDGSPRLAVVFQRPLLYPWLTVRENVAVGGRFRATRDRVDTAHIDELLARFGIADLADRDPASLSGGQAQRVAVARAAATRPDLLLLDEPFSALDPVTRAESQRWLIGIADELDVSTVMVTHDVDEALTIGTRIVLLAAGGHIAHTWENPGRTGGDELRARILDAYGAA